MKFTPTPQQMLFLWCVVTESPRTAVKDLPYKGLPAKLRKQLEDCGWINVEKIARSSRSKVNVATLTEQGWYGLQQNLSAPIAKGAATARVLQQVLAGLQGPIASGRISLVDICGALPAVATTSLSPPSHSPESDVVLESDNVKRRLYDACRRIAGEGVYNVRIRLSDLRTQLPDVSRPELDRALNELVESEAAVLNKLDDPREIRPDDEAAAIQIPGGATRHILYLSRPR